MSLRFPPDYLSFATTTTPVTTPAHHHHHHVHHPHTPPPQHDCGLLGLGCALDSFKNTVLGQSNAIQQTGGTIVKGTQNAVDSITKTGKNTQDTLNKTSDIITHLPQTLQKVSTDAAGAAGKAAGDAIGGEFNAIQKSIGPYIPYILLGGGAIVLLFLVLKR
jgi:hypothetical protein